MSPYVIFLVYFQKYDEEFHFAQILKYALLTDWFIRTEVGSSSCDFLY